MTELGKIIHFDLTLKSKLFLTRFLQPKVGLKWCQLKL